MSAFSEKGFDSKGYEQFRPRYPKELFEYVVGYSRNSTGQSLSLMDQVAVDLGCGAGQASEPLTRYFKNVIGLDPSSRMIERATEVAEEKGLLTSGENHGSLQYYQCSAEELLTNESVPIKRHSIDLITCAQAFHWIVSPESYKLIFEALKPGGTFAFWGYSDNQFLGYPEATDIYNKYAYDDPEYMGPYWGQPGRNILRNSMAEQMPLKDYFTDIQRFEDPAILPMTANVSLDEYMWYVSTWSSYYSWKVANPTKPDAAKLYRKELQQRFKWKNYDRFDIKWKSFLVLSRAIKKIK